MSRPRLLDLFSGAGGAAVGYHRAGFDVVGVDIVPQPFYPFEFVQADALEVLRCPENPLTHVHPPVCGFDAIHASPPCQAFSTMGNRSRSQGRTPGVDLLTPALELLRGFELPWVVENVSGAKKLMPGALVLSGGMFGLGVHRPRLFASNVFIPQPARAKPPLNGVGVYGRAPDGRRLFNRKSNGPYRAPRSLEEAQEAMGMDWADWHGTKEAIPPAYTEYIGRHLIASLEAAA